MDEVSHKNRMHFAWAASASARNFTCAGAIAMDTLFPDQKESEYAATGTAVHQIAEKCLRGDVDPLTFLGTIEKTEAHEIEITEKEVNSARVYVDYIRAQPGELLIEARFTLDKLATPFPAGCTADARILDLVKRHMKIIDLKNGTWFVDVNENKQLRTYALCCLLDLDAEAFAQIETIESTIVQVNAAGRSPVRSETYHKADLLDWAVDLMAAMRRSKEAKDEFDRIDGSRIRFEEWADKWLTTGNCKFCPAEGACPKRRKEALAHIPEMARKWHEDVTLETPVDLSNLARIGSPEEIAHDLDGFEELESWIKARRAYAHGLAEKGTTLPGWQLSDRIGHRAWMEKDEKALRIALAEALHLSDDHVLEPPTVKSVAQIEKTLGAKRKDEFAKLEGKLWHKPVKGTNLVSVDKTTRPPAASRAERFHEKLENCNHGNGPI